MMEFYVVDWSATQQREWKSYVRCFNLVKRYKREYGRLCSLCTEARYIWWRIDMLTRFWYALFMLSNSSKRNYLMIKKLNSREWLQLVKSFFISMLKKWKNQLMQKVNQLILSRFTTKYILFLWNSISRLLVLLIHSPT